ncbi:hypothetical protein EVAR_63151_1 [Eumeta japonica]|uniref:Uncharacterized protein n=1 Tax=Eumeta variegata TaxID=151549 RepID=A0A4C2A8C6_EUMVA|nr:hypothetical protein EVAR_63151_1 [Eumeta japonica]
MAQTAGVKPMTITGRMASQRERCLGMTDTERAWRKQWLQDQILAPNEPVHVEEYWKERLNPIRRFYRAPLDMIFNSMKGFLVRAALAGGGTYAPVRILSVQIGCDSKRNLPSPARQPRP